MRQEGPCRREGKRHLSRPRQGHTWAPQAVAPGQRLAPASLGRLPTHCGGRQLGWSPAQLRGRKLVALGGVVRVGPTQEGRVTVAQGQALEFRLALPSLSVFFFPVPED